MPVELFWYQDPFVFLTDFDNAMKIIPDKSMTVTEQLNAALRFAIGFSIIMLIIRHDVRSLFFAAFVAFVTVIIHTHYNKTNKDKKHILEHMNIKDHPYNGHCTVPTPNNPFMNVTLVDVTDFPNRPPACNVSDPHVTDKITHHFHKDTYQDIDDVFGRRSNDRQWYTMPVTTVPNDQNAFANWLYVKNAPERKITL